MADQIGKSGYPEDGGADEKLDYLASNISQTNLFESDRKVGCDPVWRLGADGSLSINAARVRPAPPQGYFLGFVKPLVEQIRTLLLRLR